ncbi:ABC transporter substrate-binding protein [Deferribacterales bacterium RsTz2092]|nr:ABC transporter substrate-binding protein [Deferribacterales bacterium]
MRKRSIAVFTALLLMMSLSLVACGKKSGDGLPVVGIAKLVSHPAMDATERGVIDELKEQGVKVEFDLQNANGDVSTAASIAAKYKSSKVRIAVGISTPVAIALAKALPNTPVIFAAVTDPLGAKLRTSNDKDTANVTGISNLAPIDEGISLATEIVATRGGSLKKLGHLYTPAEPNAVVQYGMIVKACDKMGIELVATTVTNSADVRSAVNMLLDKNVDAIYISTDNVVASALKSVTDAASARKIPVISADPSSAKSNNATAAYGVDYYKHGRETGKLVAEVLKGKFAGDIPIKYMILPSELELYLNQANAKLIGVDLGKIKK